MKEKDTDQKLEDVLACRKLLNEVRTFVPLSPGFAGGKYYICPLIKNYAKIIFPPLLKFSDKGLATPLVVLIRKNTPDASSISIAFKLL